MTDLREPYVGEGVDGARRSAQIDLEEADCMDPGEDRDMRLLSAAQWELQADRLERAAAPQPMDVDLLPGSAFHADRVGAARETSTMDDTSYRVSHAAPADDGYSAPLAEAKTRFGPDILEQPEMYGRADLETRAQMRRAVEDPRCIVRIYRAVPPEHLEINTGDWVTLSRDYAHEHGSSPDGGPDWPVVHADVPAATVWTDGNDPSEYGYGGPALHNLQPYHEGVEMPPLPQWVARSSTTSIPTDSPPAEPFRPSPGAAAERRTPPESAAGGSSVRR